MTDDIKPTEDGKLRYPAHEHDGVKYAAGYNHSFNPPVACTCVPECQSRCAGECGCEACKLVFAEYADMCGWYGPEPFVVTEEHLQQYRDALGPAKRRRT